MAAKPPGSYLIGEPRGKGLDSNESTKSFSIERRPATLIDRSLHQSNVNVNTFILREIIWICEPWGIQNESQGIVNSWCKIKYT